MSSLFARQERATRRAHAVAAAAAVAAAVAGALAAAGISACDPGTVDDPTASGGDAGALVGDGGDVGSDGGAPADPADAGGELGSDAGSSEADGAVSSGVACPEGVLFCDDFESGSLDDALWGQDLRLGVEMSVSTERAFEGAHALRFDFPTTDAARGFVLPRGVVPIEGNRIYARFYLLVTPAVTMVHSAVMEASGTLDGNWTFYGLHSNQGRLNSRYFSPTIEEHGGLKKFGDHYLSETWTCIEVLFDGEGDEIRVWFDGVEDEEMHVQPSTDPEWIAPTFDQIAIGFLTHQATDADFQVFYDAVAFDSERIGCI